MYVMCGAPKQKLKQKAYFDQLKIGTCLVILACNKPGMLTNGTVVANGSLAIYMCNLGFSLNGESIRTCQTDGSGWSGNDPKCSEYRLST